MQENDRSPGSEPGTSAISEPVGTWMNTHEYGCDLIEEFDISFGITFVTYEGEGELGDVLMHTLETSVGFFRLGWCE